MVRWKWKRIVNWIAFASRKIQKEWMKLLIEKVDNMQQTINHPVKASPPNLRAQSKNKRFPQIPQYMESMSDHYPGVCQK